MGIGVASSSGTLRKRLIRFLRLNEPETSTVLEFLRSLGSAALIGGAVRDVAREGCKAFSSDLDFVVYEGSHAAFVAEMVRRHGVPNKFGGYRVPGLGCSLDIWHIEDTWAKTSGHAEVSEVEDLLKCMPFDWDAVLFEINTRRLVMLPDYLERLREGTMELQFETNPNPVGLLVRALRRAVLWDLRFGPQLMSFVERMLSAVSWHDVTALDTKAFSTPVLMFHPPEILLRRVRG